MLPRRTRSTMTGTAGTASVSRWPARRHAGNAARSRRTGTSDARIARFADWEIRRLDHCFDQSSNLAVNLPICESANGASVFRRARLGSRGGPAGKGGDDFGQTGENPFVAFRLVQQVCLIASNAVLLLRGEAEAGQHDDRETDETIVEAHQLEHFDARTVVVE